MIILKLKAMKNIYIILVFMFLGKTKLNAQPNMINIETTENDIMIYPDNSNMHVKIVYSSKKISNLQIKIKNEKGKIVYDEAVEERKSKHEKKIDLSKLHKGVYFIEVDSESLTSVERVEFN